MLPFDYLNESNPIISRLGKEVTNWSCRSSRLSEKVEELAICLLSLDRGSETLALVEYVAEQAEFTGDFNLWSPIQYILYGGAHVAYRQGFEDLSDRLFAKATPHGGCAIISAFGERGDLKSQIQSLPKAMKRMMIVANLQSKFCVFECGRRGYPTETFDRDDALAQIEEALGLLRADLEGSASSKAARKR